VNSDPQPDAGQESKKQDAKGGARQSFWNDLGLTEPEYIDEALAPAIDEPLLRQLVRQELPENVARAVYRLIYSFSSWHQAYGTLLLDELKKARQAVDS
jgi:hypothetical protein